MDQAEAVRRADEARNYQRMLSWHLKHNAELIENARTAAEGEGKALRVWVLKSGTLGLEQRDGEPGDLDWYPSIVDEMPQP